VADLTGRLAGAARWFAHDVSGTSDRRPSTQRRVILAGIIGLATGLFSWFMASRDGAVPDITYLHTAARIFLDGGNPYAVIGTTTVVDARLTEPLYYPFPAVLLLVPFARLTTAAACGLFMGLSAALLTFLITRHDLWRVHVFASSSFVMAASLGQLSPLLMTMALLPAAGFLAVAKPNLGLALFAFRPSRQAVIGSVLIMVLSLVLLPTWPRDWLQSLRIDVGNLRVHRIPLLAPGGFLLGTALLAWRRAEARLVLALSVVPQALFFYDQLPLWLVPRTRGESIALTALSQAAVVLWYLRLAPGDLVVPAASPFVIVLLYLPALVLLLRHYQIDQRKRVSG